MDNTPYRKQRGSTGSQKTKETRGDVERKPLVLPLPPKADTATKKMLPLAPVVGGPSSPTPLQQKPILQPPPSTRAEDRLQLTVPERKPVSHRPTLTAPPSKSPQSKEPLNAPVSKAVTHKEPISTVPQKSRTTDEPTIPFPSTSSLPSFNTSTLTPLPTPVAPYPEPMTLPQPVGHTALDYASILPTLTPSISTPYQSQSSLIPPETINWLDRMPESAEPVRYSDL